MMKTKRVLSVLVWTAFALASPAWADWMLISNSGQAPNRVAVFADLESFDSHMTAQDWQTLLDADAGPKREAAFKGLRLCTTLKVLEVLETPSGPDSRLLHLALNRQEKAYQVLHGFEWERNGTHRDLSPSAWLPVEGWKTQALRFVDDQVPWREALVALLQRTQKEKTVSTQTELEPFGYEFVQGGDVATLSDITWRYIWTDVTPPPSAAGLGAAKIELAGRLGKVPRPSNSLTGVATYFNDSDSEDRGYTLAPLGTTVFLFRMDDATRTELLSQDRVSVRGFGEKVPPAVWDRRRETKVHDQQGHFVFPDVEPGLYVLECRIPYRARVSSRVPVEEVEYRDVYVDGSYDVTGRETIYQGETRTVDAPGNWTIDVVEVLGDGKATAVTLSNVR
jgi:hypothetical protein